METNGAVPMLFPYEPDIYWEQLRKIIREEIARTGKVKGQEAALMETPGLTQKPLYKIAEICQLFKVSRTTVHDWVKCGKLRKVKVRSRVYFLGNDIQQMLQQ